MPNLNENSRFYAPRDWWEGWGVVKQRREQRLTNLQRHLQIAEFFENDKVADKKEDKIIQTQILTPVLEATAGFAYPIIGTDLGAMSGTYFGTFIDFALYEKVTHYPLPVGIAIIAVSGVAGAAGGLLESLSLTPQARAGKEERLRRLHPQD